MRTHIVVTHAHTHHARVYAEKEKYPQFANNSQWRMAFVGLVQRIRLGVEEHADDFHVVLLGCNCQRRALVFPSQLQVRVCLAGHEHVEGQ